MDAVFVSEIVVESEQKNTVTNRATFTFYVALPENWTADNFESAMAALMSMLAQNDVKTLNATWACPTLGRGQTASEPVLVFERKE